MKFRKKPVVVQAINWDGSYASYLKIVQIFKDIKGRIKKIGDEIEIWEIETLEGYHVVSYHDYIIKGIKGEYYPVKEEVFNLTYERIKDAT